MNMRNGRRQRKQDWSKVILLDPQQFRDEQQKQRPNRDMSGRLKSNNEGL